MNFILQYSKLDSVNQSADKLTLDEEVTTHPLSWVLGQKGILGVGKQCQDSCYFEQTSEGLVLIAGRYYLPTGIDKFGNLDMILQKIQGHYILVRQLTGQAVTISTDPMASLPLYIYQNGEKICFSTRLDWLMQSFHDKKWEVSWSQILCYMFESSFAGRRTFINDIELANFATTYTLDASDNLAAQSYWSPPYSTDLSFEDCREELASALINAVEPFLNGSNKALVALTAGLDSRLVLAACLKVAPEKIHSMTHGFFGSEHNDVVIGRKLAEKAGVSYNFVESDSKVLSYSDELENNGYLWRNLAGQARHNFIYDFMTYDVMKEAGCDVEIKGLSGGLFKGRYHKQSPIPAINLRGKRKYFSRSRQYYKKFGGEARKAIKNLDSFYERTSYEDCPSGMADNEKLSWLIYSIKFSSRVGPRTYFQCLRFPSINPFYDKNFMELYLSISLSERYDGQIHLELIKELCPKLLELPYQSGKQLYRYPREPLKSRAVCSSKNPADWSHIRKSFMGRLGGLMDRSKQRFPEELGNLTMNDFREDALFGHPAVYRFYSLLSFVDELGQKRIAFAN